MKLSLFHVTDNPNVIGKEKKAEMQMDVLLKRSVDIVNPSLVLTDPNKTGFIGFNYLYIPDLKRYYFIDSIDNLADNLWILKCSCDVLETYGADIRNSYAYFKRPIMTGDCVDIDFDKCAYTTITKHVSDVQPEVDSVMILSTVGVS